MKSKILSYFYWLAGFVKKFCLTYTSCVLVFGGSIVYAGTDTQYIQGIQHWLDENKQYIYNKVYIIGTADSIRYVGGEKISEYEINIDVDINWTGWINRGTSRIRLHIRGGDMYAYEVSINSTPDEARSEQAKIITAGAAAAGALLILLKQIDSE